MASSTKTVRRSSAGKTKKPQRRRGERAARTQKDRTPSRRCGHSAKTQPDAPRKKNSLGTSNRPKQQIRLELMRMEILRKCDKRWDLYFLIAIEDFDERGKPRTLIGTYPENPINFSKASDNVYRFRPKGKGTDGDTVFEAAMPDDRRINMQLFVFQDKGKTRNTGRVLKEITSTIDKAAQPLVGSGNPYVMAGYAVNKTLKGVGRVLAKTKDKRRAYLNLDEEFDKEFAKKGSAVRVLSAGDIKLRWRWNVENVS